MKKILFLGALAAMLFGTASCSKDMEPEMSDGTVQFKVELPGTIDSRAISDGTTAKKLEVACYDANGNVLSNLNPIVSDFDENRVATVTVKLVKGQTYNFAFFAHADGAPFAFNAGTKLSECTFTVTDNYTGDACVSNAENRDAFYAVLEDYEVTPETTEVTLYRPFAQLNFGADDLAAAAAAGITPTQSMVTVKQVATSFNLSTGKAPAEGAVDATFNLAAIPTETLTVDGNNYSWMAMNYFLVPDNEANVDVKMTVKTNKADVEVPVTSVPVKKNHRTNIVGSLFTQDANFRVIIDERFDVPDYNIPAEFSVSANKRVEFAHGNVQYHTGTGEWRFAANQYDVIGEADNIQLGAPGHSAWVDLFAWSCTSSPYGVNPSNKDADYTGDFIDWGTKFEGGWYTPTKDEFQYLLTGRANAANLNAEGNVAGQNGHILLPDNWTLPEGLTFIPGYIGDSNDADEYFVTENIYTAAQWFEMEAAGAVFLPHAGSRTGGYGNTWNGANETTSTNPETGFYSWVDNIQVYGYYWSSTVHPTNSNLVYYLIAPGLDGNLENYTAPAIWSRERRRGNSVRLVRAIN